MKIFPAVVTGIFVILAVGAVIIFATYSSSSQNSIGSVTIWGSLPKATFDSLLNALAQGNNNYTGVSYQSVPKNQLVPALVEAIASGNPPDMVILPQEDLLAEADKLQSISYSALPRRDFQDTFIQAGENFLGANGSFGVPFTVDPLVMYWNRSIFSSAGLASPPRFWDDLSGMVPKLTKADKNGTLTQSAVALGVWTNVLHAKEILLSLFHQLGNPVVAIVNGNFQSVLSNANNAPVSPADSAVRFYTDFADPTKPVYSWNRSEPSSRDAFIGSELAIYFGFASELPGIRAANPNLDFDVAPLPQIRGGTDGAYAAVTALSIPRGSRNPSGAFAIAQALTSQASQITLANMLNVPSVRRDVSTGNGSDPFAIVFRNTSLTAFTFFDPNPSATESIFQRMIEAVFSGKLQVSAATQAASADLQALLGTH